MTNIPIHVIGQVNQAVFTESPSKFSQATQKAAQFAKRYWPYILLVTATAIVIAGAVSYIAEHNQQ